MKIFKLILMAIFPLLADAQVENALPTKDGKIYYEVIDSSIIGKPGVLYDRAKLWYVEAFRSANAVIQLDDKENMMLVGKGNFKFDYMLQPYHVWFTVKMNIKENKYRAQFYDVRVESARSSWEVPGEWFIERKPRKGERQKMSEGFSSIIGHLKTFMSKKPDNDF